MKPLPPFKIANRVIRIYTGNEGVTWPWPFRSDTEPMSPAWKARYAPQQLTQTDLFELASIANAYETLITHPSASLRDVPRVLHRIWERTCAHGALETDACAECGTEAV